MAEEHGSAMKSEGSGLGVLTRVEMMLEEHEEAFGRPPIAIRVSKSDYAALRQISFPDGPDGVPMDLNSPWGWVAIDPTLPDGEAPKIVTRERSTMTKAQAALREQDIGRR